MRSSLRPYALAELPRYTSYPTAVQFADGVGAEQWRNWLGELDAAKPVSVYVHVPFCRKLCWYCGCHTSVPNGYDRAARYVDVLLDEIAIVGDAARSHGGAGHLHFGGGTPTFLKSTDLERVIRSIDRAITIRPDAEIAIEGDPRYLDAQMIERLVGLGLNRVSLGVQDFNPEVQGKINRIQPYETVARAVDVLREAGVSGINFDLMYGLPGQTTAHVAESARLAAGLGPDRIAAFGYAHVPWFKKHQQMIRTEELPGVEARIEQAETIADALDGEGYRMIGIDHFARPGDPLSVALDARTLRRNFQGYTADDITTLIGLGCSSIGETGNGYAQNARDTLDWSTRIANGDLATVRGVALTREDRLRAAVIEQLMCYLEVDVEAQCRAHGFDNGHLDQALASCEPLAADGLVTLSGRTVRVAPDARLLARAAASRFDAYHSPAKERHSRAV